MIYMFRFGGGAIGVAAASALHSGIFAASSLSDYPKLHCQLHNKRFWSNRAQLNESLSSTVAWSEPGGTNPSRIS